jgi:hypothetical protein
MTCQLKQILYTLRKCLLEKLLADKFVYYVGSGSGSNHPFPQTGDNVTRFLTRKQEH